MKIEVARMGRMTQTGSSLMTLYQDKHTPIIDLLVREAVQNSLDAGISTNSFAENKAFVEVSFITGDFSPSRFNANLDQASEALNNRFPETTARYLAIKDRYTEGLTGPLHIKDVINHKYGNLLKLVYDICKPQENAGSGGSWGIGKTIYFRIGQGIVIYYSRIYDNELNRFQSRLAVSIVEDERSQKSIIPKSDDYCNTGIAWWGEEIGENTTIPITNEEEINKFLEIFSITPFKDKETGTIVIVPYINEADLINNNRSEDSDSINSSGFSPTTPTWRRTLDEYLRVAVQRWYFPRLNNRDYKYRKYLVCQINGKRITKDEMLPVFRLGQALYNCSVSGNIRIEEEFLKENEIKATVERIAVRKHLKDTCPGCVAFAEVDKVFMGMCPPSFCYTPFNYIDIDETESDSNPPIFGFCRKPGMIVSYKSVEKWVASVPYSEKGKYIVAIFALNSDNKLNDIDIDLEEYVRKSELANHNSWEDYPFNGTTRDIIAKIKKNTAQKLRNAFEPRQDIEDKKTNTGWGQKIADLILPREGFGKRPKTKATGIRKDLSFTNHKGISIALLEDETVYFGDSLEVSYMVKTKSPSNDVTLNTYISSEVGTIHPDEWETNGLSLPIDITKVLIRIEKIDGKSSTLAYSMLNNDNVFDNFISCQWNDSKQGNHYGVSIKFEQEHSFIMTVQFTMKLIQKNVKTTIKPI